MRPGENKLHVNESTCQSKIKNNDFKCPYFKTVLIACPQGNCLWFHQETAFEGFPSNWEELAPRAHIHYWLISHISVAISHPQCAAVPFQFFFFWSYGCPGHLSLPLFQQIFTENEITSDDCIQWEGSSDEGRGRKLQTKTEAWGVVRYRDN